MNKFPCNILVLAFALGGAATAALAAAPTHPGPSMAAQATQPANSLPAALQPVFYRALSRDAGSAYAINKDGCARLSEPKLTACFDDGGVRFTGSGSPLALHLVAWGRESIRDAGSGRLRAVESVKPTIRGNEAQYRHGDLTEWWRALPVGFEQGFTVTERPAGNGRLTLLLTMNRQGAGAPTTRHSRESGNPVNNTLAWGKLRYGQLVVTDAKGKVVPATLRSKGDRILIAVNDAHAAYPLTVDPLVWLEQKVFSSNGESGDLYGISVALDGKTALIGSRATVDGNVSQGAVYVFSESNGVWTQTQKLTASDGATADNFGRSVALSDSIALVGAPCAPADLAPPITCGPGIVYVFDDSNGLWSQTQELTSSDPRAYQFGFSLALTGTTALIGAPYSFIGGHSEQGAVYVFTDSDGTWAQSQRLTANDGVARDEFGWSIAASGPTALIGAWEADVNGNHDQGAVYAFAESDGTWTQTQKLTASDGSVHDLFGTSVALAGSIAFVGAPDVTVNDNRRQGAVYVFAESDGTWTQTQKLTAGDGSEYNGFGWAVALSDSTALIGAVGENNVNGSAYEFTESNDTWTQTQKFLPSDYATGNIFSFGGAIALSSTTALVGASDTTYYEHYGQGAAYFYGRSD